MVTGISTVSDSTEMHIFNGTNWLTDDELEGMSDQEIADTVNREYLQTPMVVSEIQHLTL